MTDDASKSFKTSVVVALVGAVFGSLVTIIGQPYVNQKFEAAKTPQLIRNVSRTNIDSLPDQIRDQISLVTTRYSLRHGSGGPAEDLTITVSASEQLQSGSLVFEPGSEPHSANERGNGIIQIEVPSIRPTGSVSFEITHEPRIEIEINEITRTGLIYSSTSLRNSGSLGWSEMAFIAVLVLLLVMLTFGGYYLLTKGAGFLLRVDEGKNVEFSADAKSFLSSLLILALLINILASFDVASMFLPHLPLSDIFYAMLIFLVATNYSDIKAAISSGGRSAGTNATDDQSSD